MLSDWYHNLSASYIPFFLSPASQGNEPVPDSALINYKGQPSTNGIDDILFTNAIFNVTKGTTIRLRLINMSAFAMFRVIVDGHQLGIIEVDGTDTEISWVDQLVLNVAQRVSVLINATDPENVGNYWIRGTILDEDLSGPCPSPNGTAILHYTNSVLSIPQTQLSAEVPVEIDWINLSPIPAEAAPGPVDQELTLDIIFLPNENNVTVPYVNGINWQPLNGTNTLYEVLSGVNASSFPVDHHVIQCNKNNVVQIILNNFDTGEHPFHLHGQYIWVLGRGTDGPYNASIHETQLNLVNPIRRDTISVQAGGWLVFRFVANNPGVWFFHCHIVWHSLSGLAMIFYTDPEDLPSFYPNGVADLPENMSSFCSNIPSAPIIPPTSTSSTSARSSTTSTTATSTTGVFSGSQSIKFDIYLFVLLVGLVANYLF